MRPFAKWIINFARAGGDLFGQEAVGVEAFGVRPIGRIVMGDLWANKYQISSRDDGG